MAHFWVQINTYFLNSGKHWDLQAAFGFAGSDVTTSRSVALSTGTVSNSSQSYVRSLYASLGGGYNQTLGKNVTARLWGRGDAQVSQAPSFTETGSAVTALTVGKQTYHTAQVSFGYDIAGKMPGAAGAAQWSLGVGGTEQLVNGDRQAPRTVGMFSTSGQVRAPNSSPFAGFVHANLNVPVGDNASFSVGLTATHAKGWDSQMANLGFQVKW